MTIDVPHPPTFRTEPSATNGSGENRSHSLDWQPLVGEALSAWHSWQHEKSRLRRWNLLIVYALMGGIILATAVLATTGVLDGQATAAIFGGAAGFLLASAGR